MGIERKSRPTAKGIDFIRCLFGFAVNVTRNALSRKELMK